jgi:uncharacterized membrane protein
MQTKMNARCHVICFAAFTLLIILLPLCHVSGQIYYRYQVQIKNDGSALWQIMFYSGAADPVDTWSSFQNKISNLLDLTTNATHRDMNVDENSVQINTTISSESKITEYTFLWQNFSQVHGNQIVFGDVFKTPAFFTQLYGDAALQVSYPSNFDIVSVNPSPNIRDDPDKTMEWDRTKDLVDANSSIVLASTSPSGSSNQNLWQEYVVFSAIVAVAAVLSFVGFYVSKRRKNVITAAKSSVVVAVNFETEEDKVLRILRSTGIMRQSDITEALGFSKAKTSQLLTALERTGSITRYKSGRDKIVNLTENAGKVNQDGKPD